MLRSVIGSIVNFWINTYRLPNGCVKELEKLCSGFLWSGPDLKTTKAKLAWGEVCKPKEEGGLGIRSIKEANQVSCVKLIWRIVSFQPTLWVNWIRKTHLHKDSFWMVKGLTRKGSWMWNKLLKYRDLARTFIRVEVHNGKNTSFWFDNWSQRGSLYELLETHGYIDLGIPRDTMIDLVLETQRNRTHRVVECD